ncbi:MAG: LysE family translocator [Pseudomonas sp.]|uniref:LysE family translocator n=1 Tax=Pseudomonas sp. TaxID=306 RepID=UPI0027365722|nr:LysE family translocator [Pseudomonas sp.]MDP3846552.1 LysE family translocator [Pseudomonas sp.]
MQQFLIIAAAHFLALISPGPDFFLVARTSMASGWKMATGACLGIALANGVFIVAAFGGVSVFRPDSTAFVAIQLVGCLYLLYMGWLFIRHAGTSPIVRIPGGVERYSAWGGSWWRGVGMGFLSGVLNPKNALFYVSLASLVSSTHTSEQWKIIYSVWMFSVVLLWDVSVAAVIGNKAVLNRFSRALPWLERISGVVLILIAVMVVASAVTRLAAGE